jgi:16S rRNA G527 N7-methylase RsmG
MESGYESDRVDFPEDVAVRHFLDSWILLPLIEELFPNRKGLRLIDVGTGAGFQACRLRF